MCVLCIQKGARAGRCLLHRLSMAQGLEPASEGFSGALRLQCSRAFSAQPQPADAPVDRPTLKPETLNANLRKAQYAVRGELLKRAMDMAAQGREIIETNVGNPQQLGQAPITFNRQVMSLVAAPFLLDNPKVGELFPKDAIARARKVLSLFKGGVGAYTDSRGSAGVRREVADFISKRDGYPSNPENIFLTDGASVAVRYLLNAVIRNSNDGILVPIPQYPLYSASIQLYGGTLLPYELKESKGWGMDMDEIRAGLRETRARGINPRALVFINPGNPTGQCLTEDNLRDLLKLCYDEGLVLMADEVYQPNIYQDEKPFVSAKKVLGDLGAPYSTAVELASFHTVSKGCLGECGLRGGYVELTNFHPGTVEEIYKAASINLSPNTMGQVAMSLMVNTEMGPESSPKYKEEMAEGLASLRRRAHAMTDAFNSLDGVTCNFTEGAMYAFPRLHLPPKALEAAKAAGKTPDTFYCLALLEETGIVTVPGSGFGQEEGTFHMRTTILPPEEKIAEFISKFKNFHEKFMATYK